MEGESRADIPIAVVLVAGGVFGERLQRIPARTLISRIGVDAAGVGAPPKLLGDAALGRGVVGDDVGHVDRGDKGVGQDARGGTGNGHGSGEEVVEGDHAVCQRDEVLV